MKKYIFSSSLCAEVIDLLAVSLFSVKHWVRKWYGYRNRFRNGFPKWPVLSVCPWDALELHIEALKFHIGVIVSLSCFDQFPFVAVCVRVCIPLPFPIAQYNATHFFSLLCYFFCFGAIHLHQIIECFVSFVFHRGVRLFALFESKLSATFLELR